MWFQEHKTSDHMLLFFTYMLGGLAAFDCHPGRLLFAVLGTHAS